MPKTKKQGIMTNLCLDARIRKKLDKYCELTGVSKTAAIERALELYLPKRVGKRPVMIEVDDEEG